MINLLIVNYNTPKLIECLLSSIKMHTPNSKVYIFDNSDKDPYINEDPNVTYFDNTKGQIIDFPSWLKRYPNRGGESTRSFGSAMHTYSIDKCMDLIDDNFILLDSDVLLKKDISELWDEDYIWVGEVAPQPKVQNIYRLLPFVCFINVKMCKEKGIRYFDENYMHGLNYTQNNPLANKYDTGGGFLYHTKDLPHKNIYFNEYVTHYKGGSWPDVYNKREGRHVEPDEWIKMYQHLWDPKYNKKRRVIYTCITGGYDNLIEPERISYDFDYVCFTDNPANNTSIFWQLRKLPECTEGLSTVKKQRFIKINPHIVLPEYDESIWVDSNIIIRGDLNKFCDSYALEKSNLFFPEHPLRNCIYDEVLACIERGKDTLKNISPQIDRYKAEGFPAHFGLSQTNILYRKHNTDECKRLMEVWWDELSKGSHRDQLSFNYASWKTGIIPYYLDKYIYKSEYFFWLTGHGEKAKMHLEKISKNTQKTKQILPIKIGYNFEHPEIREVQKPKPAFKPTTRLIFTVDLTEKTKPVTPKSGYEYIIYSDHKFTVPGWKVIVLNALKIAKDKRYVEMYFKYHPKLYITNNYQQMMYFKKDLPDNYDEMFSKLFGYNMGIFKDNELIYDYKYQDLLNDIWKYISSDFDKEKSRMNAVYSKNQSRIKVY